MNQQHTHNHGCRKPYYGQRTPETPTQKGLQHRYPRRYSKVIILTLVVYDMHRPQDIYFMRQPMVPIPNEIGSYQQQHPKEWGGFNIKDAIFPLKCVEDKIEYCCYKYIQHTLCNTYAKVSNDIVQLETTQFLFLGNGIFNKNEQYKEWDGER